MSRWKTNFQNQQIHQKIQEVLRTIQSVKIETLSPEQKTEYARAVKVLKLLEVRFATLDPELFSQNTWGSFSGWLNNVQSYANNVVQNPNSGYLPHVNNTLDEILNVLRPLDLQFSEKEVKALAEASAIYQQKLIEELERVKKRAEEVKKQYDSLSNEITQGKTRLDQNDQVMRSITA